MSSPLPIRILTLVLLIIGGWCLAVLYSGIGRMLQPAWLAIAGFHTIVALVILRWGQALRPPLRPGWGAYAPAVAILCGTVLAATLSRLLLPGAEASNGALDMHLLALVLWVPAVEEVVFRWGIGGLIRQRLGIFWGAYGSALVFALAHGAAGGKLAVPIGPLLLGLCCEWLYAKSGRLTAAIALHAACNASAPLFAAIDARWLDWLQALYLKA